MTAPTSPIQNVVVLMMENHSFDHMLGLLDGVGSLNGQQFNEVNGTRYPITEGAGYRTNPCPQHDLFDVTKQIYGTNVNTNTPPADQPPNMSGFAQDFTTIGGDPNLLMQCYSPDQLPVITALAKHFTVCTNWFCSVPGPTGPNRLYANCASTMGYAGPAYEVGLDSENNPEDGDPKSILPTALSALPSIFGALNGAGYDWGIFYQMSNSIQDPNHPSITTVNFAPELVLDDVQQGKSHGNNVLKYDPDFKAFRGLLKTKSLPTYSFLTPDLWTNSQHSPDDVRAGENLIADVYKWIANSEYWEKALFILTYDEHGGFYDSVSPPTGVQNPDGHNWTSTTPGYLPTPPYSDDSQEFTFDRLGPRVPAILISPHCKAMVDNRQYEHSSLPATMLKLFGLTWPCTNLRLNTVNTFENDIFTQTRTDLPKELPRPSMIRTTSS